MVVLKLSLETHLPTFSLLLPFFGDLTPVGLGDLVLVGVAVSDLEVRVGLRDLDGELDLISF